ncbi:MAG: PASTA domain-containing protein [Bacillaceae bacterium]|nr:PASTA domain-containing protein [Bacillaceae bacterium]
MGKKRIQARILLVGTGITLLFIILLTRLFWIQSVNADWLVKEAQNLWSRKEVLQPQRGAIFDRNGELLAYTGKAYTVIARLKPYSENDKNYVRNPVDVAEKLSPVLDVSMEDLVEQLTREDVRQVEIPRGGWKVDEETGKQIEELKLPGIILNETTRRYYPNGAFASHVLGYANLDGQAVMGIEKSQDKWLSGKPGSYEFLKDRLGYQLPNGLESITPAEDGKDVYLTLDKQIQGYVEDALDDIEQKYHPKKMTAIVADPKTGEILGMANRPHFDPNRYWDIEDYSVQINHAVSSVFEPGSTFKIVTLSAAVEEGLFHPNETYQSGAYQIGPDRIHDHNGKGWGEITFLEGVQKSSNVAFVILGYERLKKERLFEYIHKFGFGSPTGIQLPGEEDGVLRNPNRAYPVEVATMTFGQGVAVTAIQQVAAVSAVANGGTLIQPSIVKKIENPETGEVIDQFEPVQERRVISEETSEQVREILETVVTDGTGTLYQIDGYHVAGKTGTAQKPREDGRGYAPGKYIYSFVGFAPRENPELLVYVVVDEPEVDNIYLGAQVTSSIFKSIMKNSLQYMKVVPDMKTVVQEKESEFEVDDLVGYAAVTAEQKVLDAGGVPQIIGEGERVLKQYPEEGKRLRKGSTVYLVTRKTADLAMPDFTGKSLREALEYCSILGIEARFEGHGYVIDQNVPPGSPVKDNGELILYLKSRSDSQ